MLKQGAALHRQGADSLKEDNKRCSKCEALSISRQVILETLVKPSLENLKGLLIDLFE